MSFFLFSIGPYLGRVEESRDKTCIVGKPSLSFQTVPRSSQMDMSIESYGPIKREPYIITRNLKIDLFYTLVEEEVEVEVEEEEAKDRIGARWQDLQQNCRSM